MTVKVINTMQPFKPLFFILIVLVPISGLNLNLINQSEQQQQAEGSEECPPDYKLDMLGCMKPKDNFTIPPPRVTTKTECETDDNGKEKCIEKTITNGTYAYETCTEDGLCVNITQKNETSHYYTSNWNFPKLW